MIATQTNLRSSNGLFARLEMAIGIELYTVQDALARDFAGTLDLLATLGYTDVEAPNFRGRSADDWRRGFAAAGLRCLCVHDTIAGLKRDLSRQLDFVATAGAKQIVCIIPTTEALVYSGDQYLRAADDLTEMGALALDRGLMIGFHPNYVEMKGPEGQSPFDLMMARCPPHLVTLQLDVANAARAGLDPVACIDRYGTRISTLHIKDLLPDQISANGVAASIEMGDGALEWDAIFAACEGLAIEACYFELEPYGDGGGDAHGWSTSSRDRLESARLNYTYLQAL